MNVLMILIPVSMVLVLAAIGAFAWAVRGEQFEDLDVAAIDILSEDPESAPAGKDDDAV